MWHTIYEVKWVLNKYWLHQNRNFFSRVGDAPTTEHWAFAIDPDPFKLIENRIYLFSLTLLFLSHTHFLDIRGLKKAFRGPHEARQHDLCSFECHTKWESIKTWLAFYHSKTDMLPLDICGSWRHFNLKPLFYMSYVLSLSLSFQDT